MKVMLILLLALLTLGCNNSNECTGHKVEGIRVRREVDTIFVVDTLECLEGRSWHRISVGDTVIEGESFWKGM